MRVAGIELGGTKAIVALGEGPERLSRRIRVPTGAPEDTLPELIAALQTLAAEVGGFDAIGVASFGPIGVDPDRPDYGVILKTPKPGWTAAPLAATLRAAFDMPVVVDTDVNGAALAEEAWGASRGHSDHVYITLGTGLGVGVISGGRPVHGLGHPEAGHIYPRRIAGDAFQGACPFHGDCLEGLISGPALASRLGAPAETAGVDDPIWDLVAAYLAQLCHTLIVCVAPTRIVLGGGVGGRPGMAKRVSDRTSALLGGYLPALPTPESVNALITPPGLGDLSGVLGAIRLGLSATA